MHERLGDGLGRRVLDPRILERVDTRSGSRAGGGGLVAVVAMRIPPKACVAMGEAASLQRLTVQRESGRSDVRSLRRAPAPSATSASGTDFRNARRTPVAGTPVAASAHRRRSGRRSTPLSSGSRRTPGVRSRTRSSTTFPSVSDGRSRPTTPRAPRTPGRTPQRTDIHPPKPWPRRLSPRSRRTGSASAPATSGPSSPSTGRTTPRRAILRSAAPTSSTRSIPPSRNTASGSCRRSPPGPTSSPDEPAIDRAGPALGRIAVQRAVRSTVSARICDQSTASVATTTLVPSGTGRRPPGARRATAPQPVIHVPRIPRASGSLERARSRIGDRYDAVIATLDACCWNSGKTDPDPPREIRWPVAARTA